MIELTAKNLLLIAAGVVITAMLAVVSLGLLLGLIIGFLAGVICLKKYPHLFKEIFAFSFKSKNKYEKRIKELENKLARYEKLAEKPKN